jgi:hypothetical protein
MLRVMDFEDAAVLRRSVGVPEPDRCSRPEGHRSYAGLSATTAAVAACG